MNELFLKIINMSISASWLVLAVLLLRLLLKKAPKWGNVLLWGIVAIRLICPLTIESPISMIPDSVGSGELVSEWMDDYIDDIDIHHPDSVYYDAAIGAGREPISDGEGGYYVVTKHDQLGEPATIENTVMPVLSTVWIVGMAVLALYTVISYFRLRRRLDTAVRYKDNIYQSEKVSSPFVLGIIKPRIYLPFRMDAQDLEHVIAHEQAHIRRKDHWWKPLGFLLLTIHWFNPLMWLAYVLLCRDIELACDEKVIKELGNEQRADYTQALVACSVNHRMIAACPLAFGEVGVKERVKSIMNYKKPAFWVVALAVIACVIVAICFLTDPSYPPHNPIVLPAADEIDFIDITTLDGSQVSCSDKEWIEQFLTIITQAEATSKESVQDVPNVEVYGKVDISNNGGVTTFFYYIDDETYCIEQPYQGVYETDIDIETLVKGAASLPVDYEEMKFYLTIGAEGVKSIELSMPNSSGGFENADGSLLKKGERIWLENLDGYSDLRGLTITALGENGEIIWTTSIPDGEENKGFTHLVNDDWEITNIE